MASKFWPSSGNLSDDSSSDSDSEESEVVARDTSSADEEVREETSVRRDQNIEMVARQLPMGMRLPDLSIQQRASIFYLSLIEGRCRTQAASSINAGRRPEDCLSEDDPEVCDLAEHFFAEMTSDLVRAGMIPRELVHYSVPQLRQYLRSFDAILDNLATNRNNFASQQRNHSAVNSLPSFYLQSNSLIPFDPETALVQQQPTMPPVNAASRVVSSESDILSFFNLQGATASLQSVSFATSFNDVKKLGKGGFGTVFKGRYKLDNYIYAIKKVGISGKEFKELFEKGGLRTLLSEVSTMARLEHPNIVRYMNCWVETCPIGTVDRERAEEDDHEGFFSGSEDSVINTLQSTMQSISLSQNRLLDAEFTGRRRTESFNSMADLDPYNPFETIEGEEVSEEPEESDKDGDGIEEEDDEDEDDEDDETPGSGSNNQIDRVTRSNFKFDAHLFIKMKLYPLTLSEFIGKPDEMPMSKSLSQNQHSTENPSFEFPKPKHCFHPKQTLRMLQAILKGVSYLHKHNIVHRDLKPENIFLSILPADDEPTSGYFALEDCEDCYPNKGAQMSTWICPCIGDFGLVHRLGTDELVDDSTNNMPWLSDTISVDASKKRLGTKIYIPEAPQPIICPKLDVYSLGIIALELSTKFSTGFERGKIIDAVKYRKHPYPADFDKNPFSEGIKRMVQESRDNRWDMDAVRQWLETLSL